MNDDRLPEDLSALAGELRRQPLAANVLHRDQLMFECGRAAAASHPKRNSLRIGWVRQTVLVACCVCVGAMATKWIVPADVVVVESPLSPPSSPAANQSKPLIAAIASNPAKQYSEKELAAVRSGQLLCVSSDFNAFDFFNTAPRSNSPIIDGPSMRAGMWNQLSDLP